MFGVGKHGHKIYINGTIMFVLPEQRYKVKLYNNGKTVTVNPAECKATAYRMHRLSLLLENCRVRVVFSPNDHNFEFGRITDLL
jgi:hypothetical protein